MKEPWPSNTICPECGKSLISIQSSYVLLGKLRHNTCQKALYANLIRISSIKNWKERTKYIAEDHYASFSTSQKQTAERHNITQKQINMILQVYPFLIHGKIEHDPEITTAGGIESAYKILLKRKQEKKSNLLKDILK